MDGAFTCIDDLSDEEILSQLSTRPHEFLDGMVEAEAATSLGGQLTPRGQASAFEQLPIEIRDLILEHTDFSSLISLASASIRCRNMIMTFTPYRDLIKYAATVLTVLARTKLLGQHDSHKLEEALYTKGCWQCGNMGPYLFLPTCERCCFDCLDSNRSFWAIPPEKIALCFDLSPEQVKTLPILYTIPGRYPLRGTAEEEVREQYELVSVKAAKELSIKIHGLKSDGSLAAKFTPVSRIEEEDEWERLRAAPLEPIGKCPLTLPDRTDDEHHNEYFGMASTSFPYVGRNGEIEHGLWCHGCQYAADHYQKMKPSPDEIEALGYARESFSYCIVRAYAEQAYDRAAFINHVRRDCRGAKAYLCQDFGARPWLPPNAS